MPVMGLDDLNIVVGEGAGKFREHSEQRTDANTEIPRIENRNCFADRVQVVEMFRRETSYSADERNAPVRTILRQFNGCIRDREIDENVDRRDSVQSIGPSQSYTGEFRIIFSGGRDFSTHSSVDSSDGNIHGHERTSYSACSDAA